MKKMIQKSSVLFTTLILSVLIFIAAGPGFCEQPKKVAVCPLQMNAAQDLSFLQKGLFSMLSTRLADPGKVEILNRETIDKALQDVQSSPMTQGPLNESKARLIGKDLGVDYVLFGSLTMFGNSVSLDTSMVDVSAASPTLTFSRQADQPGAVITEMDKIAEEINFKTFNRKPEQFVPQTQQYAQQPQQQYRQQGDSYASPLTNYRVLMATNGEIIGMSVGDVDGDKKTEVVIAFKHAIEILEDNMDGRLVSVKKIDDAEYMNIVGIDAADINNNGVDEIFITRVHPESGNLKSYVLENTDGVYKNISGNLPWYLRVTGGERSLPQLYGQDSGKKGPYKAYKVFNVEWSNGGYVEGAKIRVPEGFNVMSMTRVANMGSVVNGTVFTDKSGKLNIVNENGSLEWTGEDGYGGTKLFYEFKDINKGLGEESEGRGTFFQPRSLAYDFKSDGRKEVFAIKNKDASDNLFGQLRNFKGGSIELLNWSELGLSSERAPKKIPGQVTDITIHDFDGDSKNELLVSFIKKSNNFSSKKSKSMIVAYDLE